MRKLKCEVGDKFGYWSVVNNTPVVKSGHSYVLAQCKCGKQELKSLSDLIHGRTTGCKSCKARERSLKISIGDKYKHWTVIEGPRITKYNCVEWEVQCNCGNTRWIQGNELVDPNRVFQCIQCARKETGSKIKILNGKVGDLDVTRFNRLKRTAKSRKIDFSLTIEYLWNLFINQKQLCTITGDFISNINDASLDRIDSTKGYVEGNVQWVTKQANLSKHVMTMDQLYQFCKKVLNHANQQPSQPLTKLEGSETNG